MIEIERKYLVNELWKKPEGGEYYVQGYLSEGGVTVRIRIVTSSEGQKRAYLTIKGRAVGISRQEYEYSVPVADAEAMLKMSVYPPIQKIRYKIPFEGKIWEVDEFLGYHSGLMVAEIELNSEDESFAKPEWVGMEVSSDKRYTNKSLSKMAATGEHIK